MKYVIPALSLLLASSTTLANPKPVTELLNGSDCQRNCISERKFGQTLLIVGRNTQGEEIGSFSVTFPRHAVLVHSQQDPNPFAANVHSKSNDGKAVVQGDATSVTSTRTYIAKPDIITLIITQVYTNKGQLLAIHGNSYNTPLAPKK